MDSQPWAWESISPCGVYAGTWVISQKLQHETINSTYTACAVFVGPPWALPLDSGTGVW